MHLVSVLLRHLVEASTSSLNRVLILVLLGLLLWGAVRHLANPTSNTLYWTRCENTTTPEFPTCNWTHPRGKLSVTFCGRLGNQLFQYASLLAISSDTCRLPAGSLADSNTLREMFPNVTLQFQDSTFSKLPKLEEKYYAKYNTELVTHVYHSAEPNLLISMYLQSYKYFQHYSDRLRNELRMSEPILIKARRYLKFVYRKVHQGMQLTGKDHISEDPLHVTFVGIHQRRGDMTAKFTYDYGYRTAGRHYFIHAMEYFRTRYDNVHFIVCSDDIKWARANIRGPDVSYAMQTAELDFAILTQCDHVIMSVGSYGWWAAWMAGGEVVYYNQPAKLGSRLWQGRCDRDYFPAEWIGMPLNIH